MALGDNWLEGFFSTPELLKKKQEQLNLLHWMQQQPSNVPTPETWGTPSTEVPARSVHQFLSEEVPKVVPPEARGKLNTLGYLTSAHSLQELPKKVEEGNIPGAILEGWGSVPGSAPMAALAKGTAAGMKALGAFDPSLASTLGVVGASRVTGTRLKDMKAAAEELKAQYGDELTNVSKKNLRTYEETGAYIDPATGQFKIHIPDINAYWKPVGKAQPGNVGPVQEAWLIHPKAGPKGEDLSIGEIYGLNPAMIGMRSGRAEGAASYHPNEKLIEINVDPARALAGDRETISAGIHELGHGISAIEGFPRGTSTLQAVHHPEFWKAEAINDPGGYADKRKIRDIQKQILKETDENVPGYISPEHAAALGIYVRDKGEVASRLEELLYNNPIPPRGLHPSTAMQLYEVPISRQLDVNKAYTDWIRAFGPPLRY